MTQTLRVSNPPPPAVFRGGWDSGTTYLPGHVVQAGTSLYQATTETTGDDPATDAGVHWLTVYEGA